jgi:hypothetical protein
MGIPFGWVKLSSAYLSRGLTLAKIFQNIESKSAISLPKHFTNGSRKFYRTVIYEETDSGKVARDVDLPPVRQTDPEQLARQVNLPHSGDNALVPDQKEPRDDAVAVWAKRPPDGHGNTLKQSAPKAPLVVVLVLVIGSNLENWNIRGCRQVTMDRCRTFVRPENRPADVSAEWPCPS